MSYPAPRRIELRVLDASSGLTLLEYGRALAAANVTDREAPQLLRLVYRQSRDTAPADLVRAMELVYAIAWQLERRSDPAITWAEAQRWNVVPAEPTPEDYEAARIEASAEELAAKVALGTGLPLADAGALTMRQVGAIGAAREASSSPGGSGRRQRRARVRR